MQKINGSNALKEEFPVNGSSALKEAYAEPERPARKPQTRRHPRRRGLTGQGKAAIFVATVALAVMASFVLTLMASLNTGYRTLGQKKDELTALEVQVDQLAAETEGASMVTASEEKAAEMGLYKVNRDQVVYISLDDEDSGEILAEDDSNVGMNAFFNKIAAIAEYFY